MGAWLHRGWPYRRRCDADGDAGAAPLQGPLGAVSPRGIHTAYYVAHTAKSLLWTASDLVTIYALVKLHGLDPGFAGWIFLIGLAMNALADLAVGAWLDRHPEGTPRLAGAGLAIAALAFPLTVLAAPLGWSALLAATFVFRIGYAAYDVPHNALLSQLAKDARATTRLSRGRTLGTGAAAAAVGLGLHLIDGAAGIAWLLWGLSTAALLGGMALLPLLVRSPAAQRSSAMAAGPGLPWRFLTASLLGIVALGAFAKGVLHLPATVSHAGVGMTLILLTAGRTAAALLPLRFIDARRGLLLLAAWYLGAAMFVVPLLRLGGWMLPLGLGLMLGMTNLIGWALLPLLARGARSYGLYTMASKLALGAAGLAMTATLGRGTTFAADGLYMLIASVILACAAAAILLVMPRLTGRSSAGGRRG
ncbi:MFS transporter [Sphingomonas sp. GB1N7]|uniref:MFS transporter n=1 Tax=Parasphingomonas caseinilytica TaxID=3096158 RepID=UPI002FCAFD57